MKNIQVLRSWSSSPDWAEGVEQSQDIASDKKRFKHSLGFGVQENWLQPSNLPAGNKRLCEHLESEESFRAANAKKEGKELESKAEVSMMEKNDPPLPLLKAFYVF